METETQVSAGGVVMREGEGGVEVALALVGPKRRWQLPKGIVDPGETPEEAALREVREETGIEADLVEPLETIEYWYVGTRRGGGRVRFHKFVHFFRMAYRAGDVGRHDREVLEARWFPADEAQERLAFANERALVAQAAARAAGG